MDVEHADSDLERLEADPSFDAGYGSALVKVFRKRLQLIRAANDERDFYALKSLHYEKLRGKRSHQRSMRLNRQWRLILEIENASPGRRVIVRGIEDYH